MAKYVPSPRDWVREQVELYESSGGTEGTTLRDTGLPVIIVTHTGNKTGAVRKTPLMRVKDGNSYVLVGSRAGHQRIRFGCTICASIRMLKSVMRPWCDRCGRARSRTRLNDLGSGSLPLRRIRLTRNTKSAPPGGFRSLLQNRDREGLGLLLFCRRHHVIAPPLMSEFGQTRRGSTFATIAAHRAAP